MYKYNECPVCSGRVFVPFIQAKDHTVSNEIFNIVSCETCNFKFTSPIPDITDMSGYYKSDDYISHSNTKRGLISRLYHLVRGYTLKKKVQLVSNYVSRGTILDYGCGTGMFINACQKSGWSAYGLEPDAGARKIAQQMSNNIFENKSALSETLSRVKFNAITLWHVLEHVTDLNDTLNFFRFSLLENGVLIIAVPNYTSYDSQHYDRFWAAYDVPRHLYHFERKTIEQLLSGFGFKLHETKPMKFDSFYVSMLSEKYKTGQINYFSAFWTGLNSNLNAVKPENYSSVIYVFKKA